MALLRVLTAPIMPADKAMQVRNDVVVGAHSVNAPVAFGNHRVSMMGIQRLYNDVQFTYVDHQRIHCTPDAYGSTG